MRTEREIEVVVNWITRVAIPKGTTLVPATNIDITAFWVEPWEGISDRDMLAVTTGILLRPADLYNEDGCDLCGEHVENGSGNYVGDDRVCDTCEIKGKG